MHPSPDCMTVMTIMMVKHTFLCNFAWLKCLSVDIEYTVYLSAYTLCIRVYIHCVFNIYVHCVIWVYVLIVFECYYVHSVFKYTQCVWVCIHCIFKCIYTVYLMYVHCVLRVYVHSVFECIYTVYLCIYLLPWSACAFDAEVL